MYSTRGKIIFYMSSWTILNSPLGSFTGQHDTVRAIKDRVGNIAGLGPGGSGLLHHRLKHLGGADDWHSGSAIVRNLNFYSLLSSFIH